MPRIPLPPGCIGFADGDRKVPAEHGPGGFFVNLEEGDPQLKKLRNQDYAAAGLVDCGPEKFFVRRGPEGRFCLACPDNTIWHSWTRVCPSCGTETVPESEMTRAKPEGQYMPYGPVGLAPA
jgi:hypothetical protein